MAADESPWYLGRAKVKEEKTEAGQWRIESESEDKCVVWSRQPFLRFGQKRLLVISIEVPKVRKSQKTTPMILFSYPGVALEGCKDNTGPPDLPQASPQVKKEGEEGATHCGFWPAGVSFRYVGPDSKPGGSAITIEWPSGHQKVEQFVIFADGSEHTKADGLWFQAVNVKTKTKTPLIKPISDSHRPSTLWPPASQDLGLHLAVVLPEKGCAATFTTFQDASADGSAATLWGYKPK